ncbi:hypothetical protein Goshw_017031, partial [Gossypium schwendimanii]|nr:hypothetical protein [Gossypium schwendimanii]
SWCIAAFVGKAPLKVLSYGGVCVKALLKVLIYSGVCGKAPLKVLSYSGVCVKAPLKILIYSGVCGKSAAKMRNNVIFDKPACNSSMLNRAIGKASELYVLPSTKHPTTNLHTELVPLFTIVMEDRSVEYIDKFQELGVSKRSYRDLSLPIA